MSLPFESVVPIPNPMIGNFKFLSIVLFFNNLKKILKNNKRFQYPEFYKIIITEILYLPFKSRFDRFSEEFKEFAIR